MGGSAVGGALYIAGKLSISNCLFYLNSATAGASASSQVLSDGDSSGEGNPGGSAVGGGLFISSSTVSAELENSVFFDNSCAGGAGGGAPGQSGGGGNGGPAIGGGLDSEAVQSLVRFCTLATNTLTAGAGGAGTTGPGPSGATAGWDICVSAGVLSLTDSILSGGTYQAQNNTPNASGVTDAGYNVCSDTSLAKSTSTTRLDANTGLDSGLSSTNGGPALGPADVSGPPMQTLALLGGPAANFIPGIAGITFSATDELLRPRGSPTSAGAFELDPVTLSSNAPPLTITSHPVGRTNAIGASATFTVSAGDIATNTVIETTTNFVTTTNVVTTNNVSITNVVIVTNVVMMTNYVTITNSIGYQWLLNGKALTGNNTFHGVTTSNFTVRPVTLADQGSYQVVVGYSTIQGVITSSVANLVAIAPPRITVQPEKKLNEPDGAIIAFTVTATGAEPLLYQWR